MTKNKLQISHKEALFSVSFFSLSWFTARHVSQSVSQPDSLARSLLTNHSGDQHDFPSVPSRPPTTSLLWFPVIILRVIMHRLLLLHLVFMHPMRSSPFNHRPVQQTTLSPHKVPSSCSSQAQRNNCSWKCFQALPIFSFVTSVICRKKKNSPHPRRLFFAVAWKGASADVINSR